MEKMSTNSDARDWVRVGLMAVAVIGYLLYLKREADRPDPQIIVLQLTEGKSTPTPTDA